MNVWTPGSCVGYAAPDMTVVYVPEFVPGMIDAEVLRRAYDEHGLLLTEDKISENSCSVSI
jgi:hypothetical protein